MKTARPLLLEKEELSARFVYRDGALFYKDNFGQRGRKGNRAGWVNNQGYRGVRFNGKNYLEHRVIWTMHHGHTDEYLDHIDGDPSNNRIENLRVGGCLGNAQNAATRKDNTSGARNVYWNKESQQWYVQLNVDGKPLYVGQVGNDFELAELIAAEARRKYHGDFASDR